MRRLLPALVLAVALPVLAQNRLPELQPLPEPPPAPPGMLDAPSEPAVNIRQGTRGEDKVEEYMRGGKVYMIKVTPSHGVPYYLVDQQGNGTFVRQDVTDSGLRVPMWVIGTF